MSLLSPTALYHAELREQLAGIGRALAFQRAVLWLARGLALGLLVDLGLSAWERLQTLGVSVAVLAAAPIVVGMAAGMLPLFLRHTPAELARRVDRAAALHERAVTALELGATNAEHPLAVAQMRDAVENLRRLELFRAFPWRVPGRELLASALLIAGTALVAFSPNPFAPAQPAVSPAEAAVADQAQRVERLAQTMQAQTSPADNQVGTELQQLAQTMRDSAGQPDSALAALQNLQDQLSQMSSADAQLSAALAAAGSALAAEPATQDLAQAIDSGDPRQIGPAASRLAQQTQQMAPAQQAAVAQALRNAATATANAAPATAAQLSAAAAALQASANGSDSSGQAGSAPPTDQSAADALNSLADSAAGAGARQLAQDQLQSSSTVIERALGQAPSTTSRPGASGQPRSASAQSGNPNSAQSGAGQSPGQDPALGQGQSQSQGAGQDQGQGQGDGTGTGQDPASGDQPGGGSGYSTGGQNVNASGAPTRIDTSGRVEDVPSQPQSPDQSQADPNLSGAAPGSASAGEQSVNPSFSRQPTQGGDNQDIPLGLRDLVRDYFSSQGQN